MSGDQLGRAFYLILLGAALLGWFLASNRNSLGRNLQYALVWGFIFLGLVAGFGLWEDVRSSALNRPRTTEAGHLEIHRAPDGHFYIPARINGVTVVFIADTGASNIVLSQKDARRIGIDTDGLLFAGVAQTANGTTRTARVTLDKVVIGEIVRTDQRAYVNEGDLFGSLLGMDYLRQFRITMTADKMIIEP